MRSQFAALPFRVKKSEVQILLLTSLDSGRWIIPKGWPMGGLTASGSAAQEAWEEAGVRGVMRDQCIGLYYYLKLMPDSGAIPCSVAVFPLEVQDLADDFPEAGLRRRKWFSPSKAAARVCEPELKRILRDFCPNRMW